MEYIPYYEMLFRKFKKENPDKTEADFISEQLTKYKKELREAERELKKLDLEKIKNSIINENEPDYKQFPAVGYPEGWLEWQIEQETEPIESRKAFAKRMISEYGIKLSRIPAEHQKVSSTSQNLYVRGKKLNSSERFEIANRTIGLWNSIKGTNFPTSQKYKLLGLILGINEDNAKKIVNGKYVSKDRPDLIKSFLDDLNK